MNWEQLKAIIWLRMRLTRNRFSRGGTLNAVLSVVMTVVLLLGGVAAGVGGFIAGAFGLPKVDPQILMLVWDGVVVVFLIFWLSGLMVEIQRSESIDLPKLLHLPITLQQVFIFNYLVSHFTPSIVLFLPAMLGLAAGLTVGIGSRLAWLIPVVLTSLFMLSAWTYCLRGWLAALMVNKRRRRTVIVWTTVIFMLVFQVPNLLINTRFRTRNRQPQNPGAATGIAAEAGRPNAFVLPPRLVQAHLVVPAGWVGYAAMSLEQRQPWPAAGAVLAGCIIGTLGLRRAYRITLRFYQGADGETQAKPVPARPQQKAATGRPLLVERRLPWLSDDTAALALATLRSLLRAPELKMALIAPVVLVFVIGSMQFTRSGHAPSEYLGLFAATAAAVMASFSFVHTMSNVFGLDRGGFRALVLLPTGRQHILLAKNLAIFPFVGVVAVVLLGLAGLLLHVPLSSLLAGVLQVPTAFLLLCLVGNFASVLAPYRLAQGTLQARKPKPMVLLFAFASILLTPFVMIPVMLSPALQLLFTFMGWVPWLPVNLLVASLMLAVVACAYWLALPAQGRLLQTRELKILREVTEELE